MFFSVLYSNGFWLEAPLALRLARLLGLFLKHYNACATICFQRKLNRYVLLPKIHFLHHHQVRLRTEAETGWAQSPLAESVQMQEDYVGKPSRTSRRVNVRRVHDRVVVRTLVSTHHALQASDTDRRGVLL